MALYTPRVRTPKLNENQLKDVLETLGAGEALTVYNTVVITPETPFAEKTVADLVSKLRLWGQLSEKQESFLLNLLEQIKNRPAIEAQRKAEKDAAEDVPTGNVLVVGEILKVKWQESYYGGALKAVVKTEQGYILYGTLPARIVNAKRGDKVSFRADVKPSDNDPKFGFYSRPTQASVESSGVSA